MGSVRMFRDRVVSMEQTQEIGEKYIELLTALALEALPGSTLSAHGLEHERDHYWLALAKETGETCRVAFTRMFLSDANRLPAVAADANAPVRSRIVACIHAQAGRAEILVTVADLLTEEELVERDEIEGEWRKKNEAALAARRAEEERRARDRQRQKQQEDARRKAQRERERRDRPAAVASAASGAPSPGEGGGRRRRRRGRSGAGGQAPGGRPQQQQHTRGAAPSPGGRPPAPQISRQAQGAQETRPSHEGGAAAEGSRSEGVGRRPGRRGRGRGAGGPRPGGTPGAPGAGSS